MKKVYSKPAFTFFELRPEERLASCQYYEGLHHMAGCNQRIFIDYGPWKSFCYDGSTTSSS
ncbi:MAG TPA: hypothetical protein GXZ65_02405 [Clostridiales bacterium]|jgi:hypothetical protein|nr:hypothetical protein [Clostridiales bacterium]